MQSRARGTRQVPADGWRLADKTSPRSHRELLMFWKSCWRAGLFGCRRPPVGTAAVGGGEAESDEPRHRHYKKYCPVYPGLVVPKIPGRSTRKQLSESREALAIYRLSRDVGGWDVLSSTVHQSSQPEILRMTIHSQDATLQK